MLKLAPELTLPLSAVAETFAFFGTRGTGKTYAAGKHVEEMHDNGAQIAVVDPVGVWYGLRLAANGRGRGLEIPVFGGLHADVPLEPTGGELVASLVVEKRISVVLDVSMFTLAQQHRFVTAFATTLFNLKKGSRSPLHVVFDEAHEFLPQFVQGSEAEMVGAVRRLSKMGRNFGIGVSLISPRPAEVNKGSVNLTERMYCGRLKGPQDRKAIEAWASSNDADASVLDQLPTLKSGDLIAWTDKGPQRVHFFPKKTFDASKTPEAGDAKPAASLPKIDLDQVREAMAATIEEAKANDPKALRARIAELERAAAKPAPVIAPPAPPVRVPAFPSELLNAAIDGWKDAEQIVARARDLANGLGVLVEKGRVIEAAGNVSAGYARTTGAPRREPASQIVAPARPRAPVGAGVDMPEGARKALTVLAQFADGVSRRKLGILAGYAPGGSSMRGILAHLRKQSPAWVDELGGDAIRATEEGLQALGSWNPLPTGDDLRRHWLGELEECPRRILQVLVENYPHALSKQNIEEQTGATGMAYTAGGSSMRGGLARLRALDLVDDVGDQIRASDHLFDTPAARGRAA